MDEDQYDSDVEQQAQAMVDWFRRVREELEDLQERVDRLEREREKAGEPEED